MGTNVYGYLLVTKSSITQIDAIVKDYWNSVNAMKQKNKECSCQIVCINCSPVFRYKLARKLGISYSKISNVKQLKDTKAFSNDFSTFVAADSMTAADFCGRIKVYDSEKRVPRTEINCCIEVVYAI